MPGDPLDGCVFALRVLQDAPVVILVLDLDGRIEYVNPFFERLAGYRLDEVRGKDWVDAFLPPREQATHRTLLGRSLGGEHVRGHVNPNVTRTADERQIEWTDEYLHDDDGRATGILAIGQDVTELQAAREALRTSEQRLAEAQRIAHIGSWEVDLRSGENWWSEQQYRINGLAPGTALSQERFLASIHPDVRGQFEREVRSAIAAGECEHEYRIVRPDGEVRCLHGRARVTLDERGQPIKMAGTDQDITERERTEEAERRTREMLDATLKALPDLMFEVDEDGRLFDYHAPSPSLLAAPPERFLGRTCHDVLPAAAADACVAAIRVAGKAGMNVDLETARGQARICVMQGLACLREALGSLDRVERILKVNGYLASAPGFVDQPKVLHAASDLLVAVCGETIRSIKKFGETSIFGDVALVEGNGVLLGQFGQTITVSATVFRANASGYVSGNVTFADSASVTVSESGGTFSFTGYALPTHFTIAEVGDVMLLRRSNASAARQMRFENYSSDADADEAYSSIIDFAFTNEPGGSVVTLALS